MAQSVKHLPLAQVMIPGSWDGAPHAVGCGGGGGGGFLLSREPASPFPLPIPPPTGASSLSLSLSQINKIVEQGKKEKLYFPVNDVLDYLNFFPMWINYAFKTNN